MFHSKKLEEIYGELNCSEKGLSSSEARERLEKYGRNEIQEGKKISPLKIFFSQFNSFIVYILIAATVIALFLGETVDAVVIFIILILNAVLGFMQEYRAEKAIDALKKLAAPKAKVLRDGKHIQINADELVPGDIIFIETGDKIPADARLIELSNLETQEASLTGESVPVAKEICILQEKAILADRRNMVFTGTIVTKGHAKAVVVSTGMRTEIGKIAKMIQAAEPETTPLQKKLNVFAKWIGIFTIIIAAIIFVLGLFIIKDMKIIDLFLTAVSLAVAAIPEGLPAVVTIALAIGIQKMAKRNALVRKLPSVETLGSTTVICTDKTGTLTKNEMTVKKIFANGKIIDVSGEGYLTKGKFSFSGKEIPAKSIELLLKTGLLCNDARIYPSVSGDPTEAALIVSSEKAGILKKNLEKEYRRVDEIPFDSERKMMSTLNAKGKEFFVFSKGAVESILKCSTRIYENGKTRKITASDRKKILEMNNKFAESALRVLAFACKESNGKISEDNLIFLGLQGMIDPPREDAITAMEKCRKAGIKVIMITGDHEITAKAIGKEFGLTGKIINGVSLEKISENELRKTVEDISIFARVNPEHKIKIVKALQANGHVVAMTGDGVNDAPAIKKADIGIAMGITGTDVAKEASVMVLTDDNFASIVNAVEEGRGIFDNIKKFVEYMLSTNLGELLTIFLGIILGMPLPLIAIQILWLNLLTDGLPAVALSIDPYDKNIMDRKPRKKKEGILTATSFRRMIAVSFVMAVSTLILFKHYLPDEAHARTVAFSALVFFQLFHVLSCKSEKIPFFKNLFSNWYLLGAVAVSVAMQLLIIYTPLSFAFKTAAIPASEWVVIVAVSSLSLVYREIDKAVTNRVEKK